MRTQFLVQLRGFSQSYDQKYPLIYERWILSVLGSGVPTPTTHTSRFNYLGTLSPKIRDTPQTYWLRRVLSVLGSGVPTHITWVGTLSPRSRSTHQGAHNYWFNYVGTPSLGSEVPTHMLGVGTLSPRSRSTDQGAYNSWFNCAGTLCPRIRSTHTYTWGGYSQP